MLLQSIFTPRLSSAPPATAVAKPSNAITPAPPLLHSGVRYLIPIPERTLMLIEARLQVAEGRSIRFANNVIKSQQERASFLRGLLANLAEQYGQTELGARLAWQQLKAHPKLQEPYQLLTHLGASPKETENLFKHLLPQNPIFKEHFIRQWKAQQPQVLQRYCTENKIQNPIKAVEGIQKRRGYEDKLMPFVLEIDHELQVLAEQAKQSLSPSHQPITTEAWLDYPNKLVVAGVHVASQLKGVPPILAVETPEGSLLRSTQLDTLNSFHSKLVGRQLQLELDEKSRPLLNIFTKHLKIGSALSRETADVPYSSLPPAAVAKAFEPLPTTQLY